MPYVVLSIIILYLQINIYNMNSKNIWKYGFNWGSIIGGAVFVYHIIGFFLKVDFSFIWSLIGTFIIVFGVGWAMINYKKNIIKENLKFGRLFGLGTIISLVISLFFTAYMVLYAAKLNPTYLDNILIQYQDMLDSMGSNLNIVDNPVFLKTINIFFFPSIYLGDFIGNLFYVLLFSIMLSRPMFGMPIQGQNRPSANDYIPYTDLKKEKDDEDKRENDDLGEMGEIETSKGDIGKEKEEKEDEK